MFNYKKKIKLNDDKLYNKILLLSRNKFFYTKLALYDTFQNRINLIFMHIAFIFINMKKKNDTTFYKSLTKDKMITNKIHINDLKKMFDVNYHTKKIDLIYRRIFK